MSADDSGVRDRQSDETAQMLGVMDTINRVRALHLETTETGVAFDCAEGDCEHDECHNGGDFPEVDFRVCKHCMSIADESGLLDEYWPGWVLYPCATIRALEAGSTLALLNGGSPS